MSKIMTESELNNFIEKVGRSELYDEIKDCNAGKFSASNPHPYPRYLKAVRVVLITLGYDAAWVEGTFADALERRYPPIIRPNN